MTLHTLEVRRRVKRRVDLDEHVWASLSILAATYPKQLATVDPSALHMEIPTECMLGQMFRHYDDGLAFLGLDADGAKTLLLNRPDRYSWDELDDAWRAAVTRYQTGATTLVATAA